MVDYVNSQRPKIVLGVIHHTIDASKIIFEQGKKKNAHPKEVKENGKSKASLHQWQVYLRLPIVRVESMHKVSFESEHGASFFVQF